MNFLFKIIPFFPKIAKARLICLQNKPNFNKLGLFVGWPFTSSHRGKHAVSVSEVKMLSLRMGLPPAGMIPGEAVREDALREGCDLRPLR